MKRYSIYPLLCIGFLVSLLFVSCGGEGEGIKTTGERGEGGKATGEETSYLYLSSEEAVFPKEGGTKKIRIDTDGSSCEVAGQPSWLHTTLNGKNLTLSCENNHSGSDYFDYVTIVSGNKNATILIKQTCKPRKLELSQNSLSFNRNGGYVDIDVNTDADRWEIEYPNRLSVQKESESFRLSIPTLNDRSKMEYVIVKAVGPDNQVILQQTISISQKGWCSACNGTGKTKCPATFCKFGRIEEVDTWSGRTYFRQCDRCGGKGTVRCPVCGGSGNQP